MDVYTMSEYAYKNGYKNGYKAGVKEFAEMLKERGIPIADKRGTGRVYVMCSNIHIDNLLNELIAKL